MVASGDFYIVVLLLLCFCFLLFITSYRKINQEKELLMIYYVKRNQRKFIFRYNNFRSIFVAVNVLSSKNSLKFFKGTQMKKVMNLLKKKLSIHLPRQLKKNLIKIVLQLVLLSGRFS